MLDAYKKIAKTAVKASNALSGSLGSATPQKPEPPKQSQTTPFTDAMQPTGSLPMPTPVEPSWGNTPVVPGPYNPMAPPQIPPGMNVDLTQGPEAQREALLRATMVPKSTAFRPDMNPLQYQVLQQLNQQLGYNDPGPFAQAAMWGMDRYTSAIEGAVAGLTGGLHDPGSLGGPMERGSSEMVNALMGRTTPTMESYRSDVPAPVRFGTELALDLAIPLPMPGAVGKAVRPAMESVEASIKKAGGFMGERGAIGRDVNTKSWYHGTQTEGLTPGTMTPDSTDIRGLFGPGVYLTDNIDVGVGYAKPRGLSKYSGKQGPVYDVKVDVEKVLDLEVPIPNDARSAFKDIPHHWFDDADMYDINVFNKLTDAPDTTGAQLYLALRNILASTGSSKDTFTELFQDLSVGLRQRGYDALTHVGGKKKVPHNVLVVFDPNDAYQVGGRTGIIKSMTPTTGPKSILPGGERGSFRFGDEGLEEVGKAIPEGGVADVSDEAFAQSVKEMGEQPHGSLSWAYHRVAGTASRLTDEVGDITQESMRKRFREQQLAKGREAEDAFRADYEAQGLGTPNISEVRQAVDDALEGFQMERYANRVFDDDDIAALKLVSDDMFKHGDVNDLRRADDVINKLERGEILPSAPGTKGGSLRQFAEQRMGLSGKVLDKHNEIVKNTPLDIAAEAGKYLGAEARDLANLVQATALGGDIGFVRQVYLLAFKNPDSIIKGFYAGKKGAVRETGVYLSKLSNKIKPGTGEPLARAIDRYFGSEEVGEAFFKAKEASPLNLVDKKIVSMSGRGSTMDTMRELYGKPGQGGGVAQAEEAMAAGGERFTVSGAVARNSPYHKISGQTQINALNSTVWDIQKKMYRSTVPRQIRRGLDDEGIARWLLDEKNHQYLLEAQTKQRTIGAFSGRGGLGPAKALTNYINTVFLAPRMYAGRMMVPRELTGLGVRDGRPHFSKQGLRFAWENAASAALGTGAILETGNLLGWWDVNFDDLDAGGLWKGKMGRVQQDITGGLISQAVDIIRLVRADDFDEFSEAFVDACRKRQAYASKIPTDLWFGETVMGDEVHPSEWDYYYRLAAPLAWQGIKDAIDIEGIDSPGGVSSLSELYGSSVYTYDSPVADMMDAKDDYAKEMGRPGEQGRSYDELEPFEKSIINNKPDIRELQRAATEESKDRGDGESMAYATIAEAKEDKYNRETALATGLANGKFDHIDRFKKEDGTLDRYERGKAVRDVASDIVSDFMAISMAVDRTWQLYKNEVPEDIDDLNDRALVEYYNLWDNVQVEGVMVDWGLFDVEEARLMDKWTPEQAAYVEENTGLISNHAPEIQEYYQMKKTLADSGYYKLDTKGKDELRARRPDIEKILTSDWYGLVPLSEKGGGASKSFSWGGGRTTGGSTQESQDAAKTYWGYQKTK